MKPKKMHAEYTSGLTNLHCESPLKIENEVYLGVHRRKSIKAEIFSRFCLFMHEVDWKGFTSMHYLNLLNLARFEINGYVDIS